MGVTSSRCRGADGPADGREAVPASSPSGSQIHLRSWMRLVASPVGGDVQRGTRLPSQHGSTHPSADRNCEVAPLFPLPVGCLRHVEDRLRKQRDMAEQIPLVDYLVLGDDPHLVANECTTCGARFFDRRNACAPCGETEFKTVDVATEGEVRAFTIVALRRARGPGALRGRRGRLRRHERAGQPDQRASPTPSTCTLGMKVRLATEVDRHRRRRHRGRRLRLRTRWEVRARWHRHARRLWILGIHMTKFGKHPDKDLIDLASEAVHGRAGRRRRRP